MAVKRLIFGMKKIEVLSILQRVSRDGANVGFRNASCIVFKDATAVS
jgi:hypothetical protein